MNTLYFYDVTRYSLQEAIRGLCGRVWMTMVHGDFVCDTFVDKLDANEYQPAQDWVTEVPL